MTTIGKPKTPVERLTWVYRYGHAWNPKYPNLRNLDLGRVLKMNGSEPDAKSLIASYQEADDNVDRLVIAFHNRSLIADGDIGPATATMMDVPRCAMPDHAPPSRASIDPAVYDDVPGLLEAILSYQEWAEAYIGGSGSWPKSGCDPQRRGVHSTRVNIDTSAASSHQKGILKEACGYTEAAEARMGQAVRHIFDGDKEDCETDCRFQYIAGGVIGFCYFPEPDTCNQTITCRIDNSYNPSAITLANLLTHEYKGHGDGLQHTNGGIMNPSIITFNPLTWIGDKHESTKRRYFGGDPVPPINPPDPPPLPSHPPFLGILNAELIAGGKIAIRGIVTLDASKPIVSGQYRFIATPDGSGGYILSPSWF